MVRGKGVSNGIALAEQFLVDAELTPRYEEARDKSAELKMLRAGREMAAEELQSTIREAASEFGQKEQEVFEAQLLLLDSDDLWKQAEKNVEENNQSAELAFHEAIEARITMFSQLNSEYLRERVLDLRDIRQRVLRCMRRKDSCGDTRERSIILVGREIVPSQLMDRRNGRVRGLAMEAGGVTSHTVLLANMMGIPCVVGAKGLLSQSAAGEDMIVNGFTGEITVSPNGEERRCYQETHDRMVREEELDRSFIGRPDQAADGTKIPLWCNIAAVRDVKQVLEHNSGGVGLMRSEFLFLGRQQAPDEEEQYTAYRQMADNLEGRPLIIRTLDIGADKQVSYLQLGEEENPALGCRAIRYCLRHRELFLTQLRAILRAGADRDVRIMFPMIASLTELRQAKALLAEARDQLNRQGIPCRQDMPTGMMIEVPSAALMAEDFAAEADFFSLGTNDLTQYVYSADRTNPTVSELNQPYGPALLRLVAQIAEKGNAAGITVAICGQAGQDPLLLPLWLAMGIGELSVSPTSVLGLRRRLSHMTKAACGALLERVLKMQTTQEVIDALRAFQANVPEESR